ncbi:unnamed protein product [Ixodes pacificus]
MTTEQRDNYVNEVKDVWMDVLVEGFDRMSLIGREPCCGSCEPTEFEAAMTIRIPCKECDSRPSSTARDRMFRMRTNETEEQRCARCRVPMFRRQGLSGIDGASERPKSDGPALVFDCRRSVPRVVRDSTPKEFGSSSRKNPRSSPLGKMKREARRLLWLVLSFLD